MASEHFLYNYMQKIYTQRLTNNHLRKIRNSLLCNMMLIATLYYNRVKYLRNYACYKVIIRVNVIIYTGEAQLLLMQHNVS